MGHELILNHIPRFVRSGYGYNGEMAYATPDWYLRLEEWKRHGEAGIKRNARMVIPNASVHDDLIRPIESTLAACEHQDALWNVVAPLLDRTQWFVDSFCSFHGQSPQYGKDLTAAIARFALLKEWDFNDAHLYREIWFAKMIGPIEMRRQGLEANPYLAGMIRTHDWARDLALSFVVYRGGHESWLHVPHAPGAFMGALALNLLSGEGLPGNRKKLEQLESKWPAWMSNVRQWHCIQQELDPPDPQAVVLWTRAEAVKMCSMLNVCRPPALSLPSLSSSEW